MYQEEMTAPPTVIDKDAYWEALECLPPLRYNQGIFAICEMLTGDITTWYAERNGKYAKCIDSVNASMNNIMKRFGEVI